MTLALSLGDFLPVWGFLAANIVTPGPNVLTTIALSMGSGRRAGLGSALGVGLGISWWCLGTTLGMSAILRVLPGVEQVLTLAAVGLLCWFAFRYFRAAWGGFRARAMRLPAQSEGVSFAGGFRRAILINAVNPKALTTWLAILGLFPVARAGGADIALLCLGACALSFGIHSAYALAFSSPAAARAYLRAGWLLQGLAGALFAGFALRLVAGT
ncbi:MAG: LysE family transporter [Cypionkella sp.]|nr:LysE family transporter [Cypionkella sp.]